VPLPDYPELDGQVFVRRIGACELMVVRGAAGEDGPAGNMESLCRFLAKALCDAEGVRVFTDDEWDAINMAVPIGALNKIGEAAQRINGLIREEVQKNSVTGQT
jgi:hypothetical protein